MKKPWFTEARQALAHSLRLRLIIVFLLLAVGMAAVFIGSLQKAFSLSWRDAARPLLVDYVDHLAADITPDKNAAPSIERAKALTQRLPITVRISGASVNWQSHPEKARLDWQREDWGDDQTWRSLVVRNTADGHRIEFGMNLSVFERRPRLLGFVLLTLLAITLLAYLYVRRLLRPLDDIRAGAQRFGSGDFAQPIPVRHAQNPDELGQLATTINTMGSDIQQMLDAKRALLLAISHELRSPLTRARLNTELLPETEQLQHNREALLRDLALMRDLVTDLLESERLASPHVTLHREQTDLAALAGEVCESVMVNHGNQPSIEQDIAGDLPLVSVDRTRVRLLLRNLLDNALRHNVSGTDASAVNLAMSRTAEGEISVRIRDFGAGVEEAMLVHLAEPFYRPDASRERATGGVGLGLYLCKLVAHAHGGTMTIRNARPGLAVSVTMPLQQLA
jgi:signal transduction histidine kinase